MQHKLLGFIHVLGFRNVCSWNTNADMVWAWILWLPYALETQTLLWFGHGCSGYRMLLDHERYYGSGMDALAADALVAP